MYLELLKEMFAEMVVKKNANLIPVYYHKGLLLYTNEVCEDYAYFLSSHENYYATPIKYNVEYDEDTFIEQGNKVAGRLWITIQKPNEPAKKLEVILIAEYKENKIYRLWELTYPDWSKLPVFKE